MTAGIAHQVLTAVIPSPKSKVRTIDRTHERQRRPPPDRGRLIVFAVEETSLPAIQWAIHNLVTPADYIHLVHAIEGEEEAAGKLPQTFARHSIETVMGVKGVGEAALTLCEAGINFDGRLLQPGISIEDALLEVIEEVQPELVILGSSQRTGSNDVGVVASEVALKCPVSVVLVK